MRILPRHRMGDGVVEIWADTALKLNERDLKVMDRLIRAQSRNIGEETSLASNVVKLHASNF